MSRLIISEQTTTPATPSSGKVAIYAKTDGYLYSMGDTGTEIPLRGGEENLADTLGFGNSTDGSDIELSAGDKIVGEASTAGHVVLHAGTPASAGDGARVDLIPGAGFGGGDPGTIRFWDATNTHYVDVLVTGSDALSVGGTYQLTYNGTTGVFYAKKAQSETIQLSETADATAPAGTSVLFVSDGSSGRTAGHLYLRIPAGTYYDLGSPTIPTTTLQTAYDAGATIVLSGTAAPVVVKSAGAGEVVQLKTASNNTLVKLKDNTTTAQVQAGAGATGSNGLGLDLLGGAGTGPGNRDGGDVNIRPGAKANSGKAGIIVFGDYDGGTDSVKVAVSSAGYPAPVMRSIPGSGSFGVTTGPVIEVLDIWAPTALPDIHQIPNNTGVLLYNPNSGLGAGVRTITLPATPVAGQIVEVKDVAGSATAAPATIQGAGGTLIDGAISKTLNTNYQSYRFVFNQNWFIL